MRLVQDAGECDYAKLDAGEHNAKRDESNATTNPADEHNVKLYAGECVMTPPKTATTTKDDH